MPHHNASTFWVVCGSLLVAMVLRILPMPPAWFVYNPDWVLLFVIYWVLAIPDRVGVGYAWCAGLLCDVLTSRMLGQHGLAYAVVAYLCIKLHRQLRLYPVYQQIFPVLSMLLLAQLLIFWTQNIRAASSMGWSYWLPAFSGALLWPAIFLVLRWLRRSYHIA
jgi:rod shape-determining protein MreD